jgi:hypothetical protein
MHKVEPIVSINATISLSEADVQRCQELKRTECYGYVLGYVTLYMLACVLPRPAGFWGLGAEIAIFAIKVCLPVTLLLYIRSRSLNIWSYIGTSCEKVFDVWRMWPGMLLIAFFLWLLTSLVSICMEALFPDIFNWHILPSTLDISPNKSISKNNFSIFELIYESVATGIVEELAMKLFFLLCIPFKLGCVGFILIDTLLIMVGHFKQSVGAVIVIAICFAIPTSWYFYKTRRVDQLIVLHIFADMFLMAPHVLK